MKFNDPIVPGLEPAFHVRADLGSLDDYGVTRAGYRRVIPVTGGLVSGGINGEILPGGADWQLVRPDGTLEIDGRYSVRTSEGELLFLQVSGVRFGPPGILDGLLRGEDVDPADYYFRTAIRIETSSARLEALQNHLYVASCVRAADSIAYLAYRVT